MTTDKKTSYFQWIRGEQIGKIVKSFGETFIDDNIEFMIFEDGSQCNTALIGEWLSPIDGPQNALILPEPDPIQKPVNNMPGHSNPPPAPQKAQAVSNPIHDLLRVSKKKKMKIQLNLEVEMPSEDLIKVINDSYDNGSSEIGNFLVASVSQEVIMEQIEKILRSKLEEITKKKRTIKNESIS
jgi:hypothetical protein